MKLRKLSSDAREELKKPMGPIIKPEEAKENAIVVGDESSYNLITAGKKPKLIIIDNKVKRNPISEDIAKVVNNFGKWIIRVENPAGHISESAWEAVKLIIEEGKYPARIEIVGEEDLMALPAIMEMKVGEYLYYGQPDVGLVEVKIDKRIKSFANKILGRMEEIEWR